MSSPMEGAASSTGETSAVTDVETPAVTDIETPIPSSSPLPPRYQSLRDRYDARTTSTTIWDPSLAASIGPFVSQPLFPPLTAELNPIVTSVPTQPTVWVARPTPPISVVPASSPEVPQSGSFVGGIPGSGPYDAYGEPITDPDYDGPVFYFDANGEFLEEISNLPHRPFEQNEESLNVWHYDTTRYAGNRDPPRQPIGPSNQGPPFHGQNPQGQPLYGPPDPGSSGHPQGQPYQEQPMGIGGPPYQ